METSLMNWGNYSKSKIALVIEAPNYEAVWKSGNKIQRIFKIDTRYSEIVSLSPVPFSPGTQ